MKKVVLIKEKATRQENIQMEMIQALKEFESGKIIQGYTRIKSQSNCKSRERHLKILKGKIKVFSYIFNCYFL